MPRLPELIESLFPSSSSLVSSSDPSSLIPSMALPIIPPSTEVRMAFETKLLLRFLRALPADSSSPLSSSDSTSSILLLPGRKTDLRCLRFEPTLSLSFETASLGSSSSDSISSILIGAKVVFLRTLAEVCCFPTELRIALPTVLRLSSPNDSIEPLVVLLSKELNVMILAGIIVPRCLFAFRTVFLGCCDSATNSDDSTIGTEVSPIIVFPPIQTFFCFFGGSGSSSSGKGVMNTSPSLSAFSLLGERDLMIDRIPFSPVGPLDLPLGLWPNITLILSSTDGLIDSSSEESSRAASISFFSSNATSGFLLGVRSFSLLLVLNMFRITFPILLVELFELSLPPTRTVCCF